MQWQAIKDWLNASPGRKRGIGAGLLGCAVVLEQLGHGQAAEGVRAANAVIQGIETTTAISGLVMTAWGWVQAHRQGRA